MFKVNSWATIGASLAIMACGSGVTDPPEGFPVAWMVQGCSPVDGVAVDLFLAETEPADVTKPPYPHIRVSIEAGAEELAHNTFTTQGNPSRIFLVQRCASESQCVSATAATVEFEENDESTVDEFRGYLNLDFSDGSSIQGSFEAHLHALLILCG